MKVARFVVLLLPIVFVWLFVVYKDFFYVFITIISLLFSILIVFPSLFSKIEIIKFSRVKRDDVVKKGKLENDINVEGKKKKKMFDYLPIGGILFLFFIVLFSVVAICKLSLISGTFNFLLEYYQSQLSFLKPLWVYFLVGVLLLSCIWSLVFGKRKSDRTKVFSGFRRFHFYFCYTSFSLVAGFIFSFITTYLFGIGEINYVAIKVNLFPSSMGVVAGKEDIIKKLQDMEGKLIIVGLDGDMKNIILSHLIVRRDGQSSYYIQRIVKSIPSSLSFKINIPKQSMVMVKNTLVVSELNKDDIQTVSPTIAKIFLKTYFKSRYLKDSVPSLTVMGRQDYLSFREKQINDRVAKLDELIKKIKDYLSSLYTSISNDKNKIATNQNGLNSSIAQRDSSYEYCNNSGYYFYGYYYRTFTQSYCDSSRSSWDNIIAGWQKNIADWQSQLRYDQKEASDYKELSDYVVSIREIVDSQREATPQELGLFEPEDNIKVVLDNSGSKAINNYFETLVHEFLHYTSYVSETKELDNFFEEGLTEYYARKTIKESLGVDINLGYPLISKIIEQMMTKISESELQDIYFTKDQSRLTAQLDAAYGKKFYEDTQYYFMAISYAPENKALKMANNIMYRIGGKELTEVDLYSSSLLGN
jgi:hypothetical protein